MYSCLLFLALSLVGVRGLRVSGHVTVSIGSDVNNVVDFGAVGDGTTDDTLAIQAAFDACREGGVVVLPSPGRYLSFALKFNASGTELRIEKGATLLINDDRTAYVAASGEHDFLTSDRFDDLAITGGGTIDGQGLKWWRHRDDFRPRCVSLKSAHRVIFHDFQVVDCPSHVLELSADFAELSKIKILAPPSDLPDDPDDESHNTDALDVHGTYMHIHDCLFDTGDDNVAFHANHTLVENSYFGHGHGTSIGSLCDNWLTNITVRDSFFNATSTAMRIKTKPKCAGRVWDVTWTNLTLLDVILPIDINMFYPGSGSLDKTTMLIEQVTFDNIRSTGHEYDGNFNCDSESPCRDFVFKELDFRQDEDEWTCHIKNSSSGSCCDSISAKEIDGVQPSGLASCFSKKQDNNPSSPLVL